MAELKTSSGAGGGDSIIHEVKQIDFKNNTFDGQKADLFINTGKLGRHFLVRVKGATGNTMLVAIHL